MWRRALLAALLLPALAPSALASPGDLRVTLAAFDRPVMPPSEAEAALVVEVPCALVPAGPASPAVRFAPDGAPEWAQARVRDERLVLDRAPCLAGGASATAETRLRVRVDASAPAFSPAEVGARATLEGGREAADGRGATTIEAGFVGRLGAEAERTFARTEPQRSVTFPVTFVNLGNGPTKVRVNVSSSDPRFPVPQPNPITLEAAGGADARRTLSIVVATPFATGRNHDETTITVAYESAHALRPDLGGGAGTLSMRVVSEGYYTPGVGLVPALGAVAGAFLLRRR